MVFSVLLWKGVSIFPVHVHEDLFDYYSSMSVVECLLDVFACSYLYCLLSLSEVMPLVFEFVLESAWLVSNCLVVDIFVVDVGCCWAPGTNIWHSQRDWGKTIDHGSKFPWFYLVILGQSDNFKVIEQTRDQASHMGIIGQDRPSISCMLSSNNPSIGPSSLHSSRHLREIDGP